MDEKAKVAEDFKRAAEQDLGRTLTEKEKKALDEFAESFLLLLDDTEEYDRGCYLCAVQYPLSSGRFSAQ